MGSDAGHLVAAGDKVSDELGCCAFSSAENNAKEFVGELFRITEVFDRVFGRCDNGLGMCGGVSTPQ
jgi:hypothetical protein